MKEKIKRGLIVHIDPTALYTKHPSVEDIREDNITEAPYFLSLIAYSSDTVSACARLYSCNSSKIQKLPLQPCDMHDESPHGYRLLVVGV